MKAPSWLSASWQRPLAASGRLSMAPMSAAVATAHRLKWRFRSPCTIETDTGKCLDMRKDSSAVIAKNVRLAVLSWRIARLTKQLPALLPPPPSSTTEHAACVHSRLLPAHVVCDNPALSTLLRSKGAVPKAVAGIWSRDDRAWLKSTAIGAQWPQSRAAAVPEWTDDASCQLCGYEQGTLEHRVHCPANVPHNGWPGPSEAASKGLELLLYWAATTEGARCDQITTANAKTAQRESTP